MSCSCLSTFVICLCVSCEFPIVVISYPFPLQGAAKFKQTSKIGNSRFRQVISDFGPSFVIVCMSLLAAQPFVSNSVFIGERASQ